jgi:hypothetical protein
MKTSCSYCFGITLDDARGHCAGCGAPRTEKHHNDPKRHLAFKVESSYDSVAESVYRVSDVVDELTQALKLNAISAEQFNLALRSIPTEIEITCSSQEQEA